MQDEYGTSIEAMDRMINMYVFCYYALKPFSPVILIKKDPNVEHTTKFYPSSSFQMNEFRVNIVLGGVWQNSLLVDFDLISIQLEGWLVKPVNANVW